MPFDNPIFAMRPIPPSLPPLADLLAPLLAALLALLLAALLALLLAALLAAAPAAADDRDCDERHLTDSVRADIHPRDAADETSASDGFFSSRAQEREWLSAMSARLVRILPRDSILRDDKTRLAFLRTVHYEASRAGLDVQKMLAIMHVESAFRKYAISSAGARGYMQVMPFWVDTIGDRETHNLFALRTNLRYGAAIFRCYLDIEKGDYYLALGRYNGSRGKAKYPRQVFAKEEKYWRWNGE